jgi:hypothetical protein
VFQLFLFSIVFVFQNTLPNARPETAQSLFGYLFSVSKTAKRVFEGYMSVWLVVFKTKTSKTKTPEKHEIRKQLQPVSKNYSLLQ